MHSSLQTGSWGGGVFVFVLFLKAFVCQCFACRHVCVPHVCLGDLRGLERALGSLDLKLWMAVNPMWGLGTKLGPYNSIRCS